MLGFQRNSDFIFFFAYLYFSAIWYQLELFQQHFPIFFKQYGRQTFEIEDLGDIENGLSPERRYFKSDAGHFLTDIRQRGNGQRGLKVAKLQGIWEVAASFKGSRLRHYWTVTILPNFDLTISSLRIWFRHKMLMLKKQPSYSHLVKCLQWVAGKFSEKF